MHFAAGVGCKRNGRRRPSRQVLRWSRRSANIGNLGDLTLLALKHFRVLPASTRLHFQKRGIGFATLRSPASAHSGSERESPATDQ